MGKANTSSGDSKSGQKSGQERPQQPQAAGNANNSDTAKTAEAQSAPQSGNDGETGEPFAEEHFETASAVADDARQDYTAESDDGAQPDLSLDEALARLAEAEAGRREAEDKLLRIQAEMQNLRRRTEQDVRRAHKFGQEKFSSELLLVMDNLERALDAASDHEDEAVKAIHEGVNLTLKSFADCFAKFNIEAVDPVGEPFDPALHQAMSIQENGEVEPDTVVAVMQKGYTLHERVLRPAMVVVSRLP